MSDEFFTPNEDPTPTEPKDTEPTPPPKPSNPYEGYHPYGSSWSSGGNVPPSDGKPPKKKNNLPVILLVVALTAAFAICVGLASAQLAGLFGDGLFSDDKSGSTTTTTTATRFQGGEAPTLEIPEYVEKDALSTAQIVADNLDCTVLINVYSKATGTDFFGYAADESNAVERLAGRASGIVMTADGYIITNQHVVVNESTGTPFSRVEVQFYNGAVYDAVVVGADSDTDLAVVKVEATDLKTAVFGDSNSVALGDRVVTLGTSGGLPWTVSQGILSGKDRDVYDKTGYQIRCLQIDATINPGNSGGPLFNSRGEVIGINSAKIVYDGYENLGFSIPIVEARKIINDLIAYGRVTGRIELGITGYDINQGGVSGVLIKTIEKGSCLENTKIKVNDVIAEINGEKVSGRTEMRRKLSQFKDGDVMKIGIIRVTGRKNGGYFGFGGSSGYEYEAFTVSITLKEG